MGFFGGGATTANADADHLSLPAHPSAPIPVQGPGVGEGVLTAIAEGGYGARPFQRVVGVDTYTPLAGAAFLVIPGDDDIVAAADRLA